MEMEGGLPRLEVLWAMYEAKIKKIRGHKSTS